MRYAVARFSQQQRDIAYRIFVTDALKLNAELLAKGFQQRVEIKRFADIYKKDYKLTPGEATRKIREKLEGGI